MRGSQRCLLLQHHILKQRRFRDSRPLIPKVFLKRLLAPLDLGARPRIWDIVPGNQDPLNSNPHKREGEEPRLYGGIQVVTGLVGISAPKQIFSPPPPSPCRHPCLLPPPSSDNTPLPLFSIKQTAPRHLLRRFLPFPRLRQAGCIGADRITQSIPTMLFT